MAADNPAVPSEPGQDRELGSLLAPYAKPVDGRTAKLESPGTLWLVTGGPMDLFAVAAEGRGDWTFLGRLEPGALLPGSVPGPDHSLFGRPQAGCALARLKLADLARVQHEEWAANRPAGGFSAEEKKRETQSREDPHKQAFRRQYN